MPKYDSLRLNERKYNMRMRHYFISHLVILFIPASAKMKYPSAKSIMATEICAYQGPRTFLLSFPQSGNTWLRYCLEVLTQRPTVRRHKMNPGAYEFNHASPLTWGAGLQIDSHKPPIEKIHEEKESLLILHNNKSTLLNHETDTLIFILRNPKEIIARSEYENFHALLNDVWKNSYKNSIYFKNLTLFDEWPAERKYLIYYENLITKPRETLAGLLAFLDESDTRLEQFMHEYDIHKNKCLALYPSTNSRGNNPLFYSKKLSPQYRKQVDIWIAEAYPELWEKYLHRYADIN